MTDETTKVDKLASNAVFTVAGRAAMILALPVLAFMGRTLIEIQIEVSVLKATVEAQMTDRYRATDAVRDLRATQLQLDNLNRRIEVIERQVPGAATRGR